MCRRLGFAGRPASVGLGRRNPGPLGLRGWRLGTVVPLALTYNVAPIDGSRSGIIGVARAWRSWSVGLGEGSEVVEVVDGDQARTSGAADQPEWGDAASCLPRPDHRDGDAEQLGGLVGGDPRRQNSSFGARGTPEVDW